MKRVVKVIYHCYGGAHSSVLAAAIHMGQLRRDTLPQREDLLKIPFFDKTQSRERGRLLSFGLDRRGVRVYAMGMGDGRRILKRALYSYLREEGVAREGLLLVNTLSKVNRCTRVGGFLSRGIGWVSLGRPLVVRGMICSYRSFVHLVEEVEETIDGEVLDGGEQI